LSAPLTVGLAIPAWRNVGGFVPASRPFDCGAGAAGAGGRGGWRRRRVAAAGVSGGRLAVRERNRGLALCHCGGAGRPADLVVLLNDDAELLGDPADAVRGAFADPALFAVTFRALRADGSLREGAKRLAWPFGFPRILHNPADQRPARAGRTPSDYAVGGHAAFHRARFAALGGFDPLFEPFYWEDVDLAQRAAVRGWSTIYLEECVVRHAGESAIRSAHDAARIAEITRRNRLLFAWRHAPASARPALAMSLGWQRLAAALRGNPIPGRAYASARARWAAGSAPPPPLALPRPAASISAAAAATSAAVRPAGL
jgi:GT2 family glycosyltransferase